MVQEEPADIVAGMLVRSAGVAKGKDDFHEFSIA